MARAKWDIAFIIYNLPFYAHQFLNVKNPYFCKILQKNSALKSLRTSLISNKLVEHAGFISHTSIVKSISFDQIWYANMTKKRLICKQKRIKSKRPEPNIFWSLANKLETSFIGFLYSNDQQNTIQFAWGGTTVKDTSCPQHMYIKVHASRYGYKVGPYFWHHYTCFEPILSGDSILVI